MTEGGAVYILAAKRTPFGKFWGALKDIPAPMLAAEVIREILKETKLNPELIDGVFMGEVLTAGVGQNPARQAALYAGLPNACDARTFNKVCSSSLVAMEHAMERIQLGKARLMIAGGMESMSRSPYFLTRQGKVFGDMEYSKLAPQSDLVLQDSMLYDGLRDIYEEFMPHMGEFADRCARAHGISREEQEAYAIASHQRAREVQENEILYLQIVPVKVGEPEISMAPIRLEPVKVEEFTFLDEGVRDPDPKKMKTMKPVFTGEGTITAATSSQISDGAAVLLLSNSYMAARLQLQPLARIVAFAVHSQEPEWYTTAPVGAIQKVLREAGLRLQDIDLFEINEAFAVVPLYAMRELGIPHEKVNIWGGAIALGHPIGASGARITGNLAHQLIHTNGRYGIAVACNGGGEAVAVLIENMRRR